LKNGKLNDAEFAAYMQQCTAETILAPSTFAVACADEEKRSERLQLIKELSWELGNDPTVYDEAWENYFSSNQQNQSLFSVQVVPLSDIKPKRAEYLICPYFPKGKLTIVGGVSGSTKTWLMLYVAAVISSGSPFFEEEIPGRKPCTVFYQTKENDYETDVRPRLDKLPAKPENIFVLDDHDPDGGFDPITLTDERLEIIMRQYSPALIVFDPIQSYLGAEVDMNQANKVRPVLDYLIDLASQYNCALVLVAHMSKKIDFGALDRLLGSSDFRNAARSIVIIGSDPEDPDSRIMAHAKNSSGPLGQSIKYHIDGEKGLVFDGYSDLTADQILPGGTTRQDGRKNRKSDALDEAINGLTELLGEDGYTTLEQVQTFQNMEGISERTMYRAKDFLELQKLSIGFNPKVTYWLAPDVDKEEFKLKHTPAPEQQKLV